MVNKSRLPAQFWVHLPRLGDGNVAERLWLRMERGGNVAEGPLSEHRERCRVLRGCVGGVGLFQERRGGGEAVGCSRKG